MTVRGWTIALEPSPEQAAQFRRDCGARRFAYNWAVAQIKEAFGAGEETGEYDRDVWSAYSLRKRWNQVKNETAHEGSSRWRKAKRKIARTQARAANIRTDAIHKATTRLAKTHGQVVIEDLAVRQLVRGIRSHRKAWADAAAGEIRCQLTHKADWYGCELWLADRWYPSSKTCSACGWVNRDLTLSDRTWSCPSCRTFHDRDENAGVNLARLPASQAEAQSNGKTGPARHAAVKRVNHLGKVAA